jgi:Fur family ferric uptake transcriptional regulator
MDISRRIEQSDIKMTKARKSILDELIRLDRPLSYEEIKDCISMDKATFYRNIAMFEEESIVTSFESNDKKRYFELKRAPHMHFICNYCNAVSCIEKPIAFDIKEHQIENVIIKGRCPNCK